MKYKILPAILVLTLMLVSTVSAFPLEEKIGVITQTLEERNAKLLEFCSERELEEFSEAEFTELKFSHGSKKSAISESVYITKGTSMSVTIFFKEIVQSIKQGKESFLNLIQLKKENIWLQDICRSNGGGGGGSSSSSSQPEPKKPCITISSTAKCPVPIVESVPVTN